MKRKFLFLCLFTILFALEACKQPEQNPTPQQKPTITAENLPAKLLFGEVTKDDGLNQLLSSGGISSSNELGTFVTNLLSTEFPGVTVKAYDPMAGCSAFINADENDGYYVGRNFDFGEAMVPQAMVIRDKPVNGDYASVSTFNLGFVQFTFPENLSEQDKLDVIARTGILVPLDGVNEKGLVVAVLNQESKPAYNLTEQKTEKVDLTVTAAVRMLLNKAATVDEAIELIQKYDLHSDIYQAHHLFIADANGNGAALDWDNVNSDTNKRGLRITRTNCLTNHPLYLSADKVSDDTILSTYGNSLTRYNTLKSALAGSSCFSFDQAKSLLHSVHQDHSRWSIVYHISQDYSEETLFWEVTVSENWNSEGYKFSVK